MKIIFEMISLHWILHILFGIQAEWKFYIQTYCQIIWVNFTNMVAKIFFPSGRPHLANHPPPSLRIFPLLPDPPFPPAFLMCGILYGWPPLRRVIHWELWVMIQINAKSFCSYVKKRFLLCNSGYCFDLAK